MKRNDSLFRLIKSLSKSEKRFFKIYSSRHVIGEQNNYIQLFDAIDKQKSYREDLILKKFAKKKFARRISVAKSYLYELILKSMNVYHAQNSVEAQLRELLGNIAFLFEKNIFDQTSKLLTKAQKLVIEYELLSFLPAIIRWQKKLLEAQFYADNSEADLFQLHEEEKTILHKLLNTNDYWLLYSRFYYHHTHQGIVGNRADLELFTQITNAPLLQDESQALSYHSQLLLYKTYSTYYFITRDFPNCYTYSKKLVNLLESRPELLKLDSMLYVNSVNNLLNMAGPMGKSDERTDYLDRLQTMMEDKSFKKSEALNIKLFQAYYYHSLIHHNSGNFTEGMPYVRAMEEGLGIYKERMDTMGVVMLCFYAFHVSFGAEEYEYAHQWLQQILTHDDSNIRQDIYNFSKILNLITVYEMGDTQLLPATIKSTYAFLYKKEKQYQLETLMLKFLKKLTQNPSSQQLKTLLLNARNDLQALQNDNMERRVFAYFDFIAWLHSKVTQKSFKQIMLEGGI